MAIQIPAILSEESGNYIMSIRLLPDGLSFSGYNPTVKGSFFLQEEKWSNAQTYAENLKEFFFSHEFMTWTYKRLYIVQTSSRYLLVPLALYLEKQKEELFALNCEKPIGKILTNELIDEQAILLYEMDEEVYEFCSRSLANPRFVHSMHALFPLWKRLSRNSMFRQMYVVVSRNEMNVACYEGRLIFSNRYSVSSLNDMLYYILYVWKLHKWDALRDQLRLSGDATLIKELKAGLLVYLKQVDLPEVPAEVYLMGTDMLRAPIDLIALYYANNQW